MASFPKPPTGGFTVSAAGKRLSAGLGGIYQKTESKVIATTLNADTVGILPAFGNQKDQADGNLITTNLLSVYSVAYINGFLYGFNVIVPSARIRFAFGVSQVAGSILKGRDSGGGNVFLKFVNVIPGLYVPNAQTTVQTGGPDISSVANGQALYPLPMVDANQPGRAVFHEGDLVYGGYDGTAANSGGSATSNGQGWPFAYEGVSKAGIYRVRVGAIATDVDVTIAIPVMAWASWEIIDPRSEEDSVALLAECRLECPNPVILG